MIIYGLYVNLLLALLIYTSFSYNKYLNGIVE